MPHNWVVENIFLLSFYTAGCSEKALDKTACLKLISLGYALTWISTTLGIKNNQTKIEFLLIGLGSRGK